MAYLGFPNEDGLIIEKDKLVEVRRKDSTRIVIPEGVKVVKEQAIDFYDYENCPRYRGETYYPGSYKYHEFFDEELEIVFPSTIKTIEYNDLESGIASIKEIIKGFDKKPILKITIRDVESDTSRVYEIIKEELGDLALMIRPTFVMAGEEIELIEVESKRLGPEQLLESQLEGYGNSEVTTLAVDLYHLLSKEKLDESQELINQYFDDHYSNEGEDSEFRTEELQIERPPKKKDDVQVTFGKEVEE